MKYHKPFLPNHTYHIYNHSVGNEFLFRENSNYIHFLNLIGKYIHPISNILAYNLLPNHFHIVIQIRNENELFKRYLNLKSNKIDKDSINWSKFISQQFSNCFNAYAKAYNKRFNRKGALFLDYLKRKEIENFKYLHNLIKYVHYNAVHHEICADINDWFWSSYKTMLSCKPSKLNKDFVINLFEGKENYINNHANKSYYYNNDLEFS